MEGGYLLGAIVLSTVFYWIGWGLVNFFREEDSPKKYFSSSLKQLFTDTTLTGVDRWFLAEQLLAVIITYCSSIIIFYKGWTTNIEFSIDQPTWISSSTLLLLSFVLCIPLMFWSTRVFALIISFSDGKMDVVDVHWLRWLHQLFKKEKKKKGALNRAKGCFNSILTFLQFWILMLQLLFSFAFCYSVLKIAFAV